MSAGRTWKAVVWMHGWVVRRQFRFVPAKAAWWERAAQWVLEKTLDVLEAP